MRLTRVLTAVTAAALLVPAAASAASYPDPSDPGTPSPRPGGKATLKVCKRGCAYKSIQAAVDAARAGDTVKVADGTYKPSKAIGISVSGHAKDGIKVIGNRRNPRKVVIEARGKQNGLIVQDANGVTVNGMTARNYSGNGFFALRTDGYLLTNLVAVGPNGVYGVYAFDSKGGTMSNSEAYYNNDSGFYIGQTPPQTKPKRTIATNLSSWGNVLGWSGSNMRYVTIKNSDFFNNGTGVVPNSWVSEKYPPEADNIITGNRIFWNNFNYFTRSPFKLREAGGGFSAFPIGVGLLLLGGHNNKVANNQVFGNWLVGVGAIQQFEMPGEADKIEKQAAKATGKEKAKLLARVKELREAAVLRNNSVTGNAFGLNGSDLNGRGLFYTGNGTGNCFANNTGLGPDQPNLPANNPAVFAPCPLSGSNTEDVSALIAAAAFLPPDKATRAEKAAFAPKGWIQHPHAASIKVRGKTVTPLVTYTK
jgi:Right handed beta helix region